MDCKVLNVGVNDLGAGMAFIKELEGISQFPFISSNIMLASTGKPAFQSNLIIESGDLKLGFVGISIGNKRAKEFTYKDPVESAKQAVKDIANKVDLVFLMANVDDATEKKIIDEVKGVDFVIRSNSRSLYRNPKEYDNTVVIRNSIQGKYAGLLKIKRTDEEQKMTNLSQQYARIKFTQNRLKSMSANLKNGETLEDHFASDAKRLNLIKNLRAETKKNEDQIVSIQNSFFFEAIPLNDKVVDAENIAVIVEEFMPEPSKH